MINRDKQNGQIVAFYRWLQARWTRLLILGTIGVMLLVLNALAPVSASTTAPHNQQTSPLSPLPPQPDLSAAIALMAQVANGSLANVTALFTEGLAAIVTNDMTSTSLVTATAQTNNAINSPLVNASATVTNSTAETVTNNAINSPLVNVTATITSSTTTTATTNNAINSPLVNVTATITNSTAETVPTDSVVNSPLPTITAAIPEQSDVATTAPARLATLAGYINRGQTSLVLVAAVLFGMLVVIGQLLWRRR